MPDSRRAHCTCCGRHRDEVGEISWGGNCSECGLRLMAENVIGIATRTGYAHHRRLRGILAYLERAAVAPPRPLP